MKKTLPDAVDVFFRVFRSVGGRAGAPMHAREGLQGGWPFIKWKTTPKHMENKAYTAEVFFGFSFLWGPFSVPWGRGLGRAMHARAVLQQGWPFIGWKTLNQPCGKC